MTFRAKLFWMFIIALVIAVGLVAASVTVATRRAFERMNRDHTQALTVQFQHELDNRRREVVRRVQGIADAEPTVQMAIDLARPQADVSVYVNEAQSVARSYQLDFLDFVGNDGSIISSSEWPARFGYKMPWITESQDWASLGSFLTKMETQEGPAAALVAVSTVRVGDRNLFILGGEKLGQEFLSSLALPAGMRALIYLNLEPNFQPTNLIDATGSALEAERFGPIIQQERQHPKEITSTISWGKDAASAEVFHALPLLGRHKDLLAVLLVGNSQHDLVVLERHIRWLSIAVAGIGFLFAVFLSWWGAARVTRPVRKLAAGAREVSAGQWHTRVDIRGSDEIAQLARAFNHMVQQLVDQRDRLVQAERVAAWRELARRLAHELKNPLFPLQTTVENLRRAKEQSPAQFDEVFRESTSILLSEIDNLGKIIARFSDFARMPRPELGPVNVNDVVRDVVKLFEAQFGAVGRPPITPELHLDDRLPTAQADAALLHRAIENLVLNAMDAMPAGGVLMLRTGSHDGEIHLEVSDTGAGLTPEECERLFTPYYTTKQHGSGLGLAIVQSVVSDHGGRISVESETGVGTSFHIELPLAPPRHEAAAVPLLPAANGHGQGK